MHYGKTLSQQTRAWPTKSMVALNIHLWISICAVLTHLPKHKVNKLKFLFIFLTMMWHSTDYKNSWGLSFASKENTSLLHLASWWCGVSGGLLGIKVLIVPGSLQGRRGWQIHTCRVSHSLTQKLPWWSELTFLHDQRAVLPCWLMFFCQWELLSPNCIAE